MSLYVFLKFRSCYTVLVERQDRDYITKHEIVAGNLPKAVTHRVGCNKSRPACGVFVILHLLVLGQIGTTLADPALTMIVSYSILILGGDTLGV